MAVGKAPLRVRIDVSPPLLAETIARLIRRAGVVTYLDLRAEPSASETVEIEITDRLRLTDTHADLVLRLPAAPPSKGADPQRLPPNVIDLTDLSELVALVGAFADDRRNDP